MLHLKTRYQPQKLRAILSLLLAFVFIASWSVQILHAHNDASLIDQGDHTEYVHTTDKCVICEYIAHKQVHSTPLVYSPLLLIRIPEAITLQRETSAGIYKCASHGFTNKAPPPVSC